MPRRAMRCKGREGDASGTAVLHRAAVGVSLRNRWGFALKDRLNRCATQEVQYHTARFTRMRTHSDDFELERCHRIREKRTLDPSRRRTELAAAFRGPIFIASRYP